MEFNNLLYDTAKKLNIEITDNQLIKFNSFYEALIEKNKVMNLTAITEYNDVVIKHFIDSILFLKLQLPINEESKIVDIGTGAGFPGIPVKIMKQNMEITLVDSLKKRLDFLDDVINSLELKKIKTVHMRAEDFGRNIKYREYYDLTISRAVADLRILSEYCIPVLRLGGYFISYKAKNSKIETKNALNAIKVLGGEYIDTITIEIPDTDIIRDLVIIKKIKETSNKYPRKAGIPNKEPIE